MFFLYVLCVKGMTGSIPIEGPIAQSENANMFATTLNKLFTAKVSDSESYNLVPDVLAVTEPVLSSSLKKKRQGVRCRRCIFVLEVLQSTCSHLHGNILKQFFIQMKHICTWRYIIVLKSWVEFATHNAHVTRTLSRITLQHWKNKQHDINWKQHGCELTVKHSASVYIYIFHY